MRFDPGQERCKFSTGQFNPPFRRFGKVKGTAFQALHPNRKYMPSEPHGEGDIAVELWKKLEPGEK